MKRRQLVLWSTRLLLGIGLGFGVRILWERKPAVRFATGLALRFVDGPEGDLSARPSHLQNGFPVRFSLDEIMAAEDPSAALRSWRQAFGAATPEARQHCLAMPVDASLTSLRRCLTQLASQPTFRDEFGQLTSLMTENMATAANPDLLCRSFAELAAMDAGLALDGAEATGDDRVKEAVWAVIAEDDPQRVLNLVASGQAPPEAVAAAVASLAARSPEAADAALAKLPEENQAGALKPMAQALASIDPVKALGMMLDEHGQPDPEWITDVARYVPATKAAELLIAIEKVYPELLRSCSEALGELASAEARRDPDFALAWFKRVATPGATMPPWTRSLLGSVAQSQPRAAAEALAAWPQSRGRDDASAEIAGAWIERRPLEALDWISRQSNSTALLEQAAASEKLRQEDAPAIAAWFSEQRALPPGGWSAANIAQKWAVADPGAAVAWAESLGDPTQRDSALGAALRQWVAVDPVTAEPRLRDAAAGRPGTLLAVLSPYGSVNDPAVSRVFFETMPSLLIRGTDDPDARSTLNNCLSQAARQRGTRDAALQALEEIPDPAWRQALLTSIAAQVPNDFSLVRRVTSLMPDQARATELMEASVRRAFR